MKAILLIVGYSVLLSWALPHAQARKTVFAATASISIPDSAAFRSQLMPLLQKKCSPCHFEGGKMYERMPFDKASTILTHETGVLRRFNNPDEKAQVEKFISEHSNRN